MRVGCRSSYNWTFQKLITPSPSLRACLQPASRPTEAPASFNPLNPIVHFWLHHTAHCAEKIVSAHLRTGSASAERVGQGEVGGVTGRVLCTWWLLGLALKRPWLAPGGPPHALTAWTGLENTTLTL